MPASARLLALTGTAALLATGIVAAAPAHAVGAKSLPFTNCSSGAKAHVTDIDADPYPLQAGRDATLTLAGSLSEQVTGGTYDLNVSYRGAPLLHASGNLADVAHLPLPAGTFDLHKHAQVPSQVPAGQYNLTLTAKDQSNADLMCVSVPFEIQ